MQKRGSFTIPTIPGKIEAKELAKITHEQKREDVRIYNMGKSSRTMIV